MLCFYLLHTSSSPPHDQRLLSSRSDQIDEDKYEEENGDEEQEDVEEIHITGGLQVCIRARVGEGHKETKEDKELAIDGR